MKGQYQMINEMLLFGVSAVIVFSAAGVISFAVESMKAETQREQYTLTGDIVSMSLAKAYLCGKFSDCGIRSDLPERLSEDRYTIRVSEGRVQVTNFETAKTVNISSPVFEGTADSFVVSSGRSFVAKKEGNTLFLTR